MKIAKAFSLIELMVVMTVMAILFAVASISYGSVMKSSRDAKRKIDMESIRQALVLYRAEEGKYPISSDYPMSCGDSGSNVNGTYGICSTSKTFLRTLPVDPKSSESYLYTPAVCTTVGSVTTCTAFTIKSSQMEKADNCDVGGGPTPPVPTPPCTKTVYLP